MIYGKINTFPMGCQTLSGGVKKFCFLHKKWQYKMYKRAKVRILILFSLEINGVSGKEGEIPNLFGGGGGTGQDKGGKMRKMQGPLARWESRMAGPIFYGWIATGNHLFRIASRFPRPTSAIEGNCRGGL